MKIQPAPLNIIGMIMSLAGIILLFFFGAPFIARTGGYDLLAASGPDPHTVQMERLYDGIGVFALLLAVAGTLCQIIAEYRRGDEMRDRLASIDNRLRRTEEQTRGRSINTEKRQQRATQRRR
jgi:hypothetical protein